MDLSKEKEAIGWYHNLSFDEQKSYQKLVMYSPTRWVSKADIISMYELLEMELNIAASQAILDDPNANYDSFSQDLAIDYFVAGCKYIIKNKKKF
jgi:hypothetical protein